MTRALGIGVCVSAGMFVAGYLGGQLFQLISPTVSATGYGLTLGLWGPAALGAHAIAEVIKEKGGFANIALGIVGGYLASWTVTNLMGFSVSMIAPFMGTAALVVTVASVVAALLLTFIAGIGATIVSYK